MKRLFPLFALFLLSLPFGDLSALPFGQVAAAFKLSPEKLLSDPVRPRVYATVPATGSVVVIDVSTLKIVADIPIGSGPSGMAISPDGTRLYVANSGSSLAAIGVVDLNTLQALPSFSLPTSATAVAAGLGNRLYVASGPNFHKLYQLDAATGAVQSTLGALAFYDDSLLVLSPDLKTLYSSVEGYSPSTISSYDVSTSTIVAKQTTRDAGSNGLDLAISHNGLYLCRPAGSGNGTPPYYTNLYSTADITAFYGSFNTGVYPGPAAFSPDDSLVYQARYSEKFIEIFDTKSFNMVQTLTLSAPSGGSYVILEVNDVEVDNTGSYLAVSRVNTYFQDITQDTLTLYSTGRGPLSPPLPAPVITSAKAAAAQTFQAFTYQIVGTGNPTSYVAAGLPPGLSLDAASGIISGSPTTAGAYAVSIGAVNSGGEGDAILNLTVTAAPLSAPVITGPIAAIGQQNQPFSYQITASNLPTRFGATALPLGLSLDTASGLISGVPTAAGVYSVMLSAQNAAGSGAQVLTLTISDAPQPVPTITSAPAADALAGRFFFYQITATGSPTNFAANGLPPGLFFNSGSGIISGTPSAVGDYPLTISAANATGTGAGNLVIHVAPAPLATISIAATEPAATADGAQAGEFTISRTGNLSGDLTVSYAIKGSAIGGVDYQKLSGSKKIKAGKESARIRIVAAGNLGGAAKKTVKLILQPGDGYTVSDASQAKVKIIAP